jgi:hypothetical protein
MPNRPKLILDEQAFQDLLSAAFTIQEHNARLNQVRQTEITTPLRSQAEPDSFCNRCGGLKPAEESRCPHCGLDEFRPGERMQRKWASMWLMSQEQSLWPERPAAGRETLKEVGEDPQEIHKDAWGAAPRSEAEQQPLLRSARDSAADSFPADLATGKANKTEATAKSAAATVRQQFRAPSVGDASVDNKGARENTTLPIESIWGPNRPTESAKDVWAPEPSDLATPTFSLQASDDLRPTGAARQGGTATERIATDGTRFDETVFDGRVFGATMSDETSVNDTLFDDTLFDETRGEEKTVDAATADNGLVDTEIIDAESGAYLSPDSASESPSLGRRLRDLRLTLRFHRANLYLGAAIFLAALALMWPTVSSPQRAELSPMERVLIALGVAEAPAPVMHSAGDPGINVWVDPHTALYYCPGEEQYGRTPNGRVSSQRDAQMDRFQPAGRTPCE